MRRLVLRKDCGIVLVDGRSQACHFKVFSRPVALLLLISLHRPTLLALKTPKNENDMFATFRLPKRSHNPSLVPVSSSFVEWAIDSTNMQWILPLSSALKTELKKVNYLFFIYCDSTSSKRSLIKYHLIKTFENPHFQVIDPI